MKKFMMIAVMAVAALTASAQQEVGSWSIAPTAGLTVTRLSGSNVQSEGRKMKAGFTVGANFTYQLNDRFAASVGAFYAQAGCKWKNRVGTIEEKETTSLGYVSVPMMAHYYVIKGLSVNAGLKLSLLVSANYKDIIDDVTMLDESIRKDCNKMDLAIPLGVSYEYMGVIVDARYNFGLTRVGKGQKSRNNGFEFTVGYKINL